MSCGRWFFVAFGLIVLCGLLLACTSASAEPASSMPTPSYSSSLRPVIAAAPVRIRFPEQGRPHLLDEVLYTLSPAIERWTTSARGGRLRVVPARSYCRSGWWRIVARLSHSRDLPPQARLADRYGSSGTDIVAWRVR